MEPMVIGGFTVQEQLGTGAAGIAYGAVNPETGEQVAIKLLSGTMLENDIVQKRFVREMGVMSKLDHPNIVKLHDCGLHEDRFYYVMEWVDYGTLKDVIQGRDPLPWREACECAVQIAEALAYAHEQGVIHRDLKPGNVFLSRQGDLKLGDFGLARDAGSHSLTADGMTVGTVTYMAPEQITGDRDITGQLDLYALGCIMYEMLIGQPPFLGRGAMEVLNHHMKTAPPDVRDINPQCPPRVADLVRGLIAKKPEDRPAGATEVVRELRAILAVAQQRAAEGVHEGETADDSNLFDRLTTSPAPREMSISWPVVIGLGVAIVAIIALALVFGQ